MYLGCFEDHTKFFDDSTLKITSNQESTISTMTPRIFLERLVSENIDVGNRGCHCNDGQQTQAVQFPYRSKLSNFTEELLGVIVVSWEYWPSPNQLAW